VTAKVGLIPIPEKALGESMEKGGKKIKGEYSRSNLNSLTLILTAGGLKEPVFPKHRITYQAKMPREICHQSFLFQGSIKRNL
jgi:hypothetical protein